MSEMPAPHTPDDCVDVMKKKLSLLVLLGLATILVGGGCSQKSKPVYSLPRTTQKQQKTTTPAERIAPNRLAQLNKSFDSLLAAGDNEKLGKMLTKIATVAELQPKEYLATAQYTADRILADAPGTPAAELAWRFRILDSYKRDGLGPSVLDGLARFVEAFPTSHAPSQLYEQLATRMVYDDDLSQVRSLVDHGVEQTAGGNYAAELTKLRGEISRRAEWTEKVRSSIKPSRSMGSNYAKLIGRPLPMQGKTLSGQAFSPDAYLGEWVYVQYWATWCPPCHPKMIEVGKKRASYEKLGVRMVGVNLDRDPNKARDFVSKHGLSWPHIFAADNKPLIMSAAVDGQVVIPMSILIAPDGRVLEAGLASIDKEIVYHVQ